MWHLSYLSFACLLVAGPYAFATEPRPLSPKHQRLFESPREDPLIRRPCEGSAEAKRTRKCIGFNTAYIFSNEWFHYAYMPYLKHRGGAYVGVGSDQGFTFIAAARSEIAWLIDYDPTVVRINKIHRTFIEASPTRAGFLELWHWTHKKRATKMLERRFGKRSKDARAVLSTYNWARKKLVWYFNRVKETGKKRTHHWLHTKQSYRYVRQMMLAKRVRIIRGNLLADRTLVGIGKAARELEIPVRVLYLSNAEEYWRYPQQFRVNMRSLPVDKHSVVLRTRYSKTWKGPTLGRYRYIVQAARDFQKRVADKKCRGVWCHFVKAKEGKYKGLYTAGKVEILSRPIADKKAKPAKTARRAARKSTKHAKHSQKH
jgi:hypothetical protein